MSKKLFPLLAFITILFLFASCNNQNVLGNSEINSIPNKQNSEDVFNGQFFEVGKTYTFYANNIEEKNAAYKMTCILDAEGQLSVIRNSIQTQNNEDAGMPQTLILAPLSVTYEEVDKFAVNYSYPGEHKVISFDPNQNEIYAATNSGTKTYKCTCKNRVDINASGACEKRIGANPSGGLGMTCRNASCAPNHCELSSETTYGALTAGPTMAFSSDNGADNGNPNLIPIQSIVFL